MNGHTRKLLPAVLRSAAITCVLAPWTVPAGAQERAMIDHPMTARLDVRVPMRDGVHLSADVYRPRDDARHPTMFELTPYNNNNDGSVEQAWHFVQRGYAVVMADVRGRYDSEGEFDPYRSDGPDGSDLMNWIAGQSWSNGKVASMGGSYTGHNQWMMAKENNPHHAAIVSYVAPADEFQDGARYNGVPKLDLMYTWMMGMYGHVNQSIHGWNWPVIMWQLPLDRLDSVAGRDLKIWRERMQHDTQDDYWTPMQMRGFYDRFDIPSFNVTGWFEGQLKGQVQNYVNTVRHTKDPTAHMLIIGPWLHSVNRNRRVGERDYGPQAIIDLDKIRDQWLDHRMLGTSAADLPTVMYFLPVKNEWRRAAAWPVPQTRFTQYYLESGGRANTLLGDGVLRQGVVGAGKPDEFAYDPANPVPTVSSRTAGARGGLPQGPVDNRAVETRPDVLVYTSEPLREGLEVSGPVTATIHFSTDVPDTDMSLKLLDVYPDGRALNLSEGIGRARYRTSYTKPELLEPGKVYAIEVELFPTANYFEPGHRIRIEVSSSDFPNFGRNLNTGKSSETTTEMRVAHTRILHSRDYPSQILLPLVPAGTTTAMNP